MLEGERILKVVPVQVPLYAIRLVPALQESKVLVPLHAIGLVPTIQESKVGVPVYTIRLVPTIQESKRIPTVLQATTFQTNDTRLQSEEA
jgi:hypothetical protein